MFAWQAELSPVTKLALPILQLNNQATQKRLTEEMYFPQTLVSYSIKDPEKQKYSRRGMLQIGANFAPLVKHIRHHQVFDLSSPGWPSGLGKRLQTAVRGFNSPSRLQPEEKALSIVRLRERGKSLIKLINGYLKR